MTSGPVYGSGFVELEPQLSRDFLAKINNQLDRAFSNIKLNVDDSSIRTVRSQLDLVEGSADRAAKQVGQIAREASASTDDFKLLAKHMDISEDEARRLAIEVGKAQVETRQLDDAAQRVAKSLGLSQSEARRFADQMNRAADSGAAVSRLDTTIGNLRSSLSRAAIAAVAFFGVRGVINQAQLARDAFIDLGESVNAVQVVFGDASDTIFSFSDRVAQSAGLARSEFQQMSTVIGAALQNAGLDADVAAQKTITLTQRAADLASVFNTDVSEALGAIQAALRGESDPIERFGVTLSAAKVDAEAAALGFSKVAGEFDATAKTAARLSLIMEQTSKVAGDFANTSDSLANRQRIAAAEMENVRAELGEALLPIFESLVDIGPQVVEGLKDLTPALAAMAESAAGLVESTPGVIDFMDALHLVTDLPRGFGQLFDGIKLGLSTIIPGLGDAEAALQSMTERRNTQGLIDDLREGGDAATVLANRLVEVGRKGKLSPEFIRQLRQIAGTDLQQSAAVLEALVTDAERLGLSAEEIAMLNVEFARLRNEIQPVGNEIGQATLAMADFHRTTRDFPRVVTSFDDLKVAAEETGRSLVDLVLGLDPVSRSMVEALTPTQETALAMHAVQTEAGAAAEILSANLRPAIADVSGAFKDLNEDGRVTTAEFIQNAKDMTAAALQLAIDLSTIAAIDVGTALALSKLDPAVAADLIRDFAADPAGIKAAAEALFGTPRQLGNAILDVYVAALDVLQGGDPKAIANFLAFTKEITEESVPGVTDAFEALFQPALNASFADLEVPDITPAFVSMLGDMDSKQLTAALDPVLDASFADLEIPDLTQQVKASIDQWNSSTLADAVENALFANVDIDLTQEGIQSRATYLAGLSTPAPGEVSNLRSSITATLDSAIYRDSPPKLFLDAGVDSADAFWSGFEGQAMKFPGLDLAKSFTASRAATIDAEVVPGAGFGGPAIENVNFYDSREKPAEESLQEAGARVAVMLNLRK